LNFWWDSGSEIQLSQSSREWKFKSDNAALISCVLSIQDMIREPRIPSDLEIGGGPLLFAPPILEDISGHELVRYFGNSPLIEISRSVEVIWSRCFTKYKSLKHLTFELGSRLKVIEDFAFRETGLKAIEIPCTVKILGICCFCQCYSLVSVTFASGSKLEEIPRSGFVSTQLSVIVIPASVKVISSYAFTFCSELQSVAFEAWSQLHEVHQTAFAGFPCEGTICYPSSYREMSD
jgi:hypothetical protein